MRVMRECAFALGLICRYLFICVDFFSYVYVSFDMLCGCVCVEMNNVVWVMRDQACACVCMCVCVCVCVHVW